MNACKEYLIFNEEDDYTAEDTGTGCFYVTATGQRISLPDLRRY